MNDILCSSVNEVKHTFWICCLCQCKEQTALGYLKWIVILKSLLDGSTEWFFLFISAVIHLLFSSVIRFVTKFLQWWFWILNIWVYRDYSEYENLIENRLSFNILVISPLNNCWNCLYWTLLLNTLISSPENSSFDTYIFSEQHLCTHIASGTRGSMA